jgi:hypothetical protein
MTPSSKVSMMLVAGVMVGCRPSAQSTADTTAASSSTIPAVTAGPSDSVSGGTLSGQSSNTPAAGGSKTTKRGSTSAKSSGTSTRRANDAAEDKGIIGRDSVIRFPHRGLPTVSSTPVRK